MEEKNMIILMAEIKKEPPWVKYYSEMIWIKIFFVSELYLSAITKRSFTVQPLSLSASL